MQSENHIALPLITIRKSIKFWGTKHLHSFVAPVGPANSEEEELKRIAAIPLLEPPTPVEIPPGGWAAFFGKDIDGKIDYAGPVSALKHN